jgi:hypothetical protein
VRVRSGAGVDNSGGICQLGPQQPAGGPLRKGEFLVLHRAAGRLAAVERHHPADVWLGSPGRGLAAAAVPNLSQPVQYLLSQEAREEHLKEHCLSSAWMEDLAC